MTITRSALLCTFLSAVVYAEHTETLRWLILVLFVFFLCFAANSDFGVTATFQAIVACFTVMCFARRVWGKSAEEPSDVDENSRRAVKDSHSTGNQPKRRGRRDKKRKKNRAMDEDSESLPPIPPEMTKVYPALPKYLSLNLSDYELYWEFVPFQQTQEQLQEQGFPLDEPNNPGRLRSKSCGSSRTLLRHCHRCGLQFHVSEKKQYMCETICHYHPQRITSLQGVPSAGSYLCCEGDYLSQGCKTRRYHVSAEHFLDDVEFCRVREKKQVRGGQAFSVYALDCEMCYTTAGLEVTRVGLVGTDGRTVYNSFVLPQNPILDYNTQYSGVTANDLKGVTTTLMDVQAFLLKLLNKDSILVGHGLENDLKALRLIHEKIVDTSTVFPHRFGGSYKRSLKDLAKEFLQQDIQNSSQGHDCIQDSRTCMDLMLLKVEEALQGRPPLATSLANTKNSLTVSPVQPQFTVPVPHFVPLHYSVYEDTYFYSLHHYGALPAKYDFTSFSTETWIADCYC